MIPPTDNPSPAEDAREQRPWHLHAHEAPPAHEQLIGGLSVQVRHGDQPLPSSARAVLRLSPLALTYLAPGSTPEEPGQPLQLRCLPEDPTERALSLVGYVGARRPAAAPGMVEVDVSLGEIDPAGARTILGLLSHLRGRGLALRRTQPAELETITDPQRIGSVLTALFARRAAGRLRPGQSDGGWLRPINVRLEPPARLFVQWEARTPLLRPPFEIETYGYNSAFRFHLDHIEDPVPLPSSLLRLRWRSYRRMAAPPRLFVQFRHPLWPGVEVRRPVRDLSFEGLSFSVDAEAALLFPGLTLDAVEVSWKGGAPLGYRGTVCHISPGSDGGAEVCGLRLFPRSLEDAARAATELERLFYPGTRTGRAAAERWSEIWDLYAQSGYFGLSQKIPANFDHLRESFRRSSERLADAPELGCQVIRPTEERIEGTVAQLKIYSGTWLVYQLARYERGRPLWLAGSDILQDLHTRGYEHAQRDPELRWLMSYVQTAARFSRLFPHDVTERYVDSGKACLHRCRALEGPCDGPVPPLPPDVAVGPASPEECTQLGEVLRRERPALYREALDLVPARLDLGTLRGEWARRGLLRDRAIVVARRGGAAGAAAVLDIAEEGIHLFGLLDAARLYALAPGGEELFLPLLGEARRWYLARGKGHFTYFMESGELAPVLAAGFRDLGEADMTILSVDLLPEQMEGLYEITAPTAPSTSTVPRV